MFSPERVRTPGKALSGGEQNRAVLAKLFCKPANLLVLDEPTNDLDIETLELLEDLLLNFDGTILLVSHDRNFMDNVITSLIVLEGNGVVSEHVGGFSDWEAHGGRLPDPQTPGQENFSADIAPATKEPVAPSTSPAKTKPKLSYKDQRELELLPETIEKLEQQQSELEAKISRPDFYQSEPAEVDRVLQALSQVQEQLEETFSRWEALDSDH